MSLIEKFDRYLSDDGPAALVIREYLAPAEGEDGVVFPPTYASGEGFPGGYNIDGDPNGENICLIDSVGSQANRIEPIFAEENYKDLIPQVVVKAGEENINILKAGHRAGDAIVRCSALKQELQNAFKSLLKGDATPLAKIAPTSLVFGVWDSRDTQAKLPRIIASTIRAYNVRKLKRSAQYVPATEYVAQKLLDEPDEKDKKMKEAYAERGFVHVPATGSHGGVIVKGFIRRDAVLGLTPIKLLFAANDPGKTNALRRYILGLALVAFTRRPMDYLRQGCLLVHDRDRASQNEFVEVLHTGERIPVTIDHMQALKYAYEAARGFGVGESRTVDFDKERAKKDVAGDGDTKTKGKKGKKADVKDKSDDKEEN